MTIHYYLQYVFLPHQKNVEYIHIHIKQYALFTSGQSSH